MTLTVIVRENTKSDYRIVMRNTSLYDVAVKIVNPNRGLILDRSECLVLSNKYTEISVLETPSKSLFGSQQPVLIYCRAIYPFNRKNIRHWIEGHVTDKPHHLVQSLNFVIDDSEFSAKTVGSCDEQRAERVSDHRRPARKVDDDRVDWIRHQDEQL